MLALVFFQWSDKRNIAVQLFGCYPGMSSVIHYHYYWSHFVVIGLFICAQSSNISAFHGILHVCSTEDVAEPMPATSEDTWCLSVSAFLGNPS